ncbi:hypothetical protein B0H14DRAFT_3471816 [Mycena olivaceomarginata]|nr:hypothetical protein B0H14DRAFT_3471816 [Mycena olivaceomarginata]
MPRQIPPRRVETILQAVGVFINRVQEIPDFKDIVRWNAAWEAQLPSLNPGIGHLESLNSTFYTKNTLAEATFLLRRIGPASNRFVRSPALIKITISVARLIFYLAIQTAICTSDAGFIAVLGELLVRKFPRSEFGGNVAASAVNATGLSTDQWEAELFTSDLGARYARLMSRPRRCRWM